MGSNARGEVTAILTEICEGDERAADRLLPLVYDELRSIARHYLSDQPAGHTLQPTALVHEAYVDLVSAPNADWEGRRHFLAIAALAMRELLIDHARRKGRLKRGGGWRRVTLAEPSEDSGLEADLLDLDAALRELAELEPRHARVVELRYFGGMTIEETAEVLGLGLATVKRDWTFARAWLRDRLS